MIAQAKKPKFATMACRASRIFILFCFVCLSRCGVPEKLGATTSGSSDSHAEVKAAATLPCNGLVSNCFRPLNHIAFPTAHNAMSSKAEKWGLPNQPNGLRAQLDAGITGMMIDVHPNDGSIDPAALGKPMLCHGYCVLGQRDLQDAFEDMREWLQTHPRTAIVLVVEDYVAETAIDLALKAAQLRSLCIEHATGTPWPTLAALIDSDTRVLIMLESGKGSLPWNHAYQTIAFDTPYSAETPEEFSCDVLRGKAGNDFFVVNHFLTKGLSSHEGLAKVVNHNPLLLDRVRKCATKHNQRVNLIAVNWHTEGDVLAVAQLLNGEP